MLDTSPHPIPNACDCNVTYDAHSNTGHGSGDTSLIFYEEPRLVSKISVIDFLEIRITARNLYRM